MMLRLVALLAAAVLPACAPVDLLNATVSTGGVSVTRGLGYGADPRQHLDVYRPDAPQPGHPAVVFFYGGSWDAGSRADYRFVAATLARRGLLVFVPDYRLYPQIGYPDFLRDCAAATVWAQAHAAEYGGRPDDLFLMGHSAGAYNAAMLALDPRWLREAGGDPKILRGMIGLAGPYDFLPMTGKTVRAVFGADNANPATQPIAHVDGRNPPLLLLQGQADTTVYPKNTINLAAAIRAKGGPVEDHLYPNVAHIGIVISIAPLFQGKDPALTDTLAFIARHKTP